MIEPFPYHINVFYSTEDGAWIAAVPDLQNANASGASIEEAVRELWVVVEMWLDSWMEDHDAPPPVKYRPAPLSYAS